jgi:FkbM family methyltransferase
LVDVGANHGYYSLVGALWNPALRVACFEPVPQIYERLKKNIALNNLGDRVVPYRFALSDRTGRATFFLPATTGRDYESTGTLVEDTWQKRKQSPSFEVDTIRFDDFERSHHMKVDVVNEDRRRGLRGRRPSRHARNDIAGSTFYCLRDTASATQK